jgi:hypothetical protein
MFCSTFITRLYSVKNTEKTMFSECLTYLYWYSFKYLTGINIFVIKRKSTFSTALRMRLITCIYYDFFCVGVMYSGEYDICDVTLSVYPHRASLKNMPVHGVDIYSE